MPQPVRFYIFVIIAVVVLFIIGMFTSQQSVEIAGCKASWYTYTKQVKSDLCPNPGVECNAEPYKQQHNALIDMFVCACDKYNTYLVSSDPNTQQLATQVATEIADSYQEMTKKKSTAEDICSGSSLVKWKY
ncbi:MAG: hypothetical protein HZB67_04275 [Candidatus Aenigmarchaeota archaeon]|nr:hypothetical protein [Candidatus Aenigmarchaeota archaeon]